MGVGRVRLGQLLLLAFVLLGAWMPGAAQETGDVGDATPVATMPGPVETPVPTLTADRTPAPDLDVGTGTTPGAPETPVATATDVGAGTDASLPAAQETPEEVAITVRMSTEDGAPVPATAQVQIYDFLTGSVQLSPAGASEWTTTVPAGLISHSVLSAAPYLDVPQRTILVTSSTVIEIVLELPRIVPVTFEVATSDGEPVPATLRICVWDTHAWTRCSDAGVATWTTDVLAQRFDYWTKGNAPYLAIERYEASIPEGEPTTIPITLQRARLVEVTFNLVTEDGGAVPPSLQLCVWDEIGTTTCADPGVAEATLTVRADDFDYWTWRSYPYEDVDVQNASLPEGETAIQVVLQRAIPRQTNITKVVSESNPAPGSEITYTIHAWGIAPSGQAQIWDDIPPEFTVTAFDCTIAAGMSAEGPC